MPEKEKKQDEKYRFVSVTACEKCNTVVPEPMPCPKCGNLTFTYTLKVVTIGKKKDK